MLDTHIPFLNRIRQHVSGGRSGLTAVDRIAVRSSWVAKGEDIIVAGSANRHVVSIGSGIAMRYRLLRDGSRQIIMFLFPGDACNINLFSNWRHDDSVAAVTAVRVDRINHEAMLEAIRVESAVNLGLWAMAEEENAIIRDQITSLGRCETRVRIAALLCDLLKRFQATGGGSAIALPITQSLMADSVGVTHIHFNRVISEFAKAGLVETRRGTLFIRNAVALEDIAQPLRTSRQQ